MNETTRNKLGELILSIAQGNAKAVDEINSILGSAMGKVAKVYVRNIEDAADAVQESFCKIVEKAYTFRENKNPCAWIYTIVKNTAKDFLRDNIRRSKIVYEQEPYYVPDDNTLILREAFQVLTEKELDLITYTFWFDMSLFEISRATRIPKSTVKYRLDKALLKLRKFLEK